MKVVLIYDEPITASVHELLSEDIGAEFETTNAIDGLCQALEANGHEVVPLPFNVDFFHPWLVCLRTLLLISRRAFGGPPGNRLSPHGSSIWVFPIPARTD